MLPIDEARRLIADHDFHVVFRTRVCVCGQPKADHSGARHSGGVPGTRCRRYRIDRRVELAVRALEAADSNPMADVDRHQAIVNPRPTPPEGRPNLGPSDYLTCRHQLQLLHRPPADIFYDPVPVGPAAMGTSTHNAVGEARSELYGWRLIERQVTIPGLDRPGRFDDFDPVLGRLSDLKTGSDYMIREARDLGGLASHWGQLGIYGTGLQAEGHKVNELHLEYVAREDGDFMSFTRPFDPVAGRRAVNWLQSTSLAISLGLELPRDRPGPKTDPICADWCPVRSYCWRTGPAAAAGRSPESYTVLGAKPRAASIRWAAAKTHELQREKRHATKEASAAKALLEGLRGTYGEWEVRQKTRWVADYELWRQRVLEAVARGATAEEIAAIPVPKVRQGPWTEITRTSKGAASS